jgi:hypothetical protein
MPVFFATRSILSYCDGKVGYPDGTLFLMLEEEAFAILNREGHDRVRVCVALGLPARAWDGHEVFLVKAPAANPDKLRMPSGNEMGVDDQWLPGGVHKKGFRQAVGDPVALDACGVMEIQWKS